jgi:hypothetical protein
MLTSNHQEIDMLEFFTKLDDNDALVLLRKDHDKVKGLFEEFEKAENYTPEKENRGRCHQRIKDSRNNRRRNLLPNPAQQKSG